MPSGHGSFLLVRDFRTKFGGYYKATPAVLVAPLLERQQQRDQLAAVLVENIAIRRQFEVTSGPEPIDSLVI